MGAISNKEAEERIEDISMQIEEVSAMAGGMLYIDILRKIAENLAISLDQTLWRQKDGQT